MSTYESLITQIAQADEKDISHDFVKDLKRKFAKAHKLPEVPSNIQLLRTYHDMLKDKKMEPSLIVEGILKKRSIRSQSGIVSVQVLTKPYRCPGKCIFCPNDFTMPKSYINTEPGAMRALLNNFDPIKQVYNRLLSLTLTGHKTDKIEMIVLGGTRDVYPDDYKEQFIKGLYDACNTFQQYFEKVRMHPDPEKKYSYMIDDVDDIIYSDNIEQAQTINETTENRMIGLTVETRPEYVTDKNCQFRRKLGVTRLEMGIQSMYDDVLRANKRGHDVQASRDAVHKLRQYGYKMSVHLMPGLYGSDYDKDVDTFRQVYDDPTLRPDEIKFYPTSVIPNTELYDLYREGKYKPLTTDVIKKLIRETFLHIIPPYTRIKRLIRDIPSTEIIAGSNITNLSQLTHRELRKKLKDTPEIQKLYQRLYGDYSLFDTKEEFIMALKKGTVIVDYESSFHHGDPEMSSGGQVMTKGIKTYIVGQDPDVRSYRNFVSLDTRSREIRHKWQTQQGLPQVTGKKDEVVNLIVRKYRSSVGWEYFISFEDIQGYLYAFTRLLIPDDAQTVDFPGLGAKTAMIRELHVYGQVQSLKNNISSDKHSQHTGFGRQLMDMAEQISAVYWYNRLSVIAGIGVRGYYEKLGYTLDGTYMVKNISKK